MNVITVACILSATVIDRFTHKIGLSAFMPKMVKQLPAKIVDDCILNKPSSLSFIAYNSISAL